MAHKFKVGDRVGYKSGLNDRVYPGTVKALDEDRWFTMAWDPPGFYMPAAGKMLSTHELAAHFFLIEEKPPVDADAAAAAGGAHARALVELARAKAAYAVLFKAEREGHGAVDRAQAAVAEAFHTMQQAVNKAAG